MRTLQLVPLETRLKDLRADYRDMAPMMFDGKPIVRRGHCSHPEITGRHQRFAGFAVITSGCGVSTGESCVAWPNYAVNLRRAAQKIR